MFLVIIHYQKPIEEVERWLEAHRNHLQNHYDRGHLLASGPQNPRTGGILITALDDRAQVEAMVQADPFTQHQIATFQLIEFNPVKGSGEFYQALEVAKKQAL